MGDQNLESIRKHRQFNQFVLAGCGPLDKELGATFSLTAGGGYTDGWQPRTDGAQGDIYTHVRTPIGEHDAVDFMFGYFQGFRNMQSPVLIDKEGNRLPGIDRDANLAVPDLNSLDLGEYRTALSWDRAWTPNLNSKLSLGYWHGDTAWKVGRPETVRPPGRSFSGRRACGTGRRIICSHSTKCRRITGWDRICEAPYPLGATWNIPIGTINPAPSTRPVRAAFLSIWPPCRSRPKHLYL